MVHLDANFLITALIPGSREETRLLGRLSAGEAVATSAVSWGEFFCGPLTPAGEAAARQILTAIEPLLPEDAEQAARFFNLTGRRSRSFQDCMIAAVAIRCGSRLATANVADFTPLSAYGLRLA
jgi:predicted nucleic acid-binding protein